MFKLAFGRVIGFACCVALVVAAATTRATAQTPAYATYHTYGPNHVFAGTVNLYFEDAHSYSLDPTDDKYVFEWNDKGDRWALQARTHGTNDRQTILTTRASNSPSGSLHRYLDGIGALWIFTNYDVGVSSVPNSSALVMRSWARLNNGTYLAYLETRIADGWPEWVLVYEAPVIGTPVVERAIVRVY